MTTPSFAHYAALAEQRIAKDRILSLGLIWQTVSMDLGFNARYVRIHFRHSFRPMWLYGKALYFANYVDKHTFVVMDEEIADEIASSTLADVRKRKDWPLYRYDTKQVDLRPNELLKSLSLSNFRKKASYLVPHIFHAGEISYQVIIKKFKEVYL